MVQYSKAPRAGRFRALPEDRKVLQRWYPGWAVLVEKLTSPFLRAKDVRRILGLTYRQIHTWNTQKLLWFARSSETEWRRFSIADIFGLALVKRVAEWGIPFSKLQKSFAIKAGVPSLLWNALPHLIAGREGYLYTDFENFSFLGGPDHESANKLLKIRTDAMGKDPIVVLSLKPILNDLVDELDLPDFRALLNADGSYSFQINGVPLRLEDLSYLDKEPEQLPKVPRRKARKQK